MARNKDKELRCSFCGKPQSVVDRLIAGTEAFICGDCINLCYTLVHDQMYEDEEYGYDVSGDLNLDIDQLPTPMEMKERFLNLYHHLFQICTYYNQKLDVFHQ